MDGTVDESLVFAAKQVNERQKRSIFAAVCEKLCDGSARKTEERFGWSSKHEDEIRLPRGGLKPSEVRNPQLAIDIRLIVEPHTHSDPELKSTRLYTNFSAAEVRNSLSRMGYTDERLPSERTLRDILNRMNYRQVLCPRCRFLAFDSINGCFPILSIVHVPIRTTTILKRE